MAKSQKFIERNRAPRVQIAYDIETFNGPKRVELPFIMGVMADLSGKPEDPLAPLTDRKFSDIDMDNFDDTLKAAKPRVAFQVPNTLTKEGNMSVAISFDRLDDFSPAAVARKVEPLRKLFEARQRLDNLLSYVDGKDDAEQLLADILDNKQVMQAICAAPSPAKEEEKKEEKK
jgi:type VI secretion system protein ImpB